MEFPSLVTRITPTITAAGTSEMVLRDEISHLRPIPFHDNNDGGERSLQHVANPIGDSADLVSASSCIMLYSCPLYSGFIRFFVFCLTPNFFATLSFALLCSRISFLDFYLEHCLLLKPKLSFMLDEGPETTQRQRADIYYILFQFISNVYYRFFHSSFYK